MVASYDSAMFQVIELFTTNHSTVNVCVWRLHVCVVGFTQLLAMGVAKTSELNN